MRLIPYFSGSKKKPTELTPFTFTGATTFSQLDHWPSKWPEREDEDLNEFRWVCDEDWKKREFGVHLLFNRSDISIFEVAADNPKAGVHIGWKYQSMAPQDTYLGVVQPVTPYYQIDSGPVHFEIEFQIATDLATGLSGSIFAWRDISTHLSFLRLVFKAGSAKVMQYALEYVDNRGALQRSDWIDVPNISTITENTVTLHVYSIPESNRIYLRHENESVGVLWEEEQKYYPKRGYEVLVFDEVRDQGRSNYFMYLHKLAVDREEY